jgi:ribbon-helix-helix CopG family protein
LQYNEGAEDWVQDQLTVRLPEDLSRALRAASRRMQRKSSEIVRLALREFLGVAPGARTVPADRVRNLIGSLESGVPDLAEKHRAYIVESLRRGR